MAQSARAYDYYGTAAPKREWRQRQRQTRPDVRVVRGRNADHQTLAPQLVLGFRIAVALIVVFLAVCGLRVWFAANTVSALQHVEALEESVEKAYAAGDELEIEHSRLASTSRIQREAAALGMSSPYSRTYLKVALPAKVAYDRDGSISIAGTLDNIEQSIPAKKTKSKKK